MHKYQHPKLLPKVVLVVSPGCESLVETRGEGKEGGEGKGGYSYHMWMEKLRIVAEKPPLL